MAEVTTNIAIENTDLTSLAGWFPKLVFVTGNVQITNNAALSMIDDPFQTLHTVSRNFFGTDLLVALGSAFPFPGGGGLVTGYVSIYNNPIAVLPSLGSAFHGLDTATGCCTDYGNAALVTLDMAFGNLVTVAGYSSIHDNDELALEEC